MGILLFIIPGMKDIKQSNQLNKLRNTGCFITSEPHIAVFISLRNNTSLSVNTAGGDNLLKIVGQRSHRNASIYCIYCFHLLFFFYYLFF